MSELDLMKVMDSASIHALYDTLMERVDKSAIVIVHTIAGESIKIKGDKHIFIIDVTSDYITLKMDSHITDIMFNAIERIEYYGGIYGRYDDKKNKKR